MVQFAKVPTVRNSSHIRSMPSLRQCALDDRCCRWVPSIIEKKQGNRLPMTPSETENGAKLTFISPRGGTGPPFTLFPTPKVRTDDNPFRHRASINPDHFHRLIRRVDEVMNPTTRHHGGCTVIEEIFPAFNLT